MLTRNLFIVPVFAAFICAFSGKKEQLLQLSKKYFPENYAVLKDCDEAYLSSLVSGNSPAEFISDVSTAVHEAYHHYHGRHSSYFDSVLLYRINDTLTFGVKNLRTFPAIEINNIVPAATRKKIFRYDTYVNTKDKIIVTQQFGLLGLLEEMTAYYQTFSTELSLFTYYNDKYGWKKPEAWMAYLGNMGSYRFAITEFELFTSWYIQYAKTKYPAIYKSIMNNAGLKKILSFLHKENRRLSAQYDLNREMMLKQFDGKLSIEGNFIFNKDSRTGKGLYDDEVKEMNDLLELPEHKPYKELLR